MRRAELPAELAVKLTEEELAFFRVSCDLFPTQESPLAAIEAELSPDDIERVYSELAKKKLLRSDGSGASPELADRLEPVSECDARVLVRYDRFTRDWYVAHGVAVEYRRDNDGHGLGDPRSESALAAELAQL